MPITVADLTPIVLELDSAWMNSQAGVSAYKPQAPTVLAMLAKQQIGATRNLIQPLIDNVKDNQVKVVWYDFCGQEAQDCEEGNTCTLTGTALNATSKTYEIDKCLKHSFKVNEQDYAKTSLSVQGAISAGIQNSLKVILESLNEKAIAVLEASAFDGGTVETTDIKGIVELIKQAQLNGIENPFGIDGGNFYSSYFIADAGRNNADGKGDANIASMLQMYFDMLGFSKMGVSNATYLMSPYSYAILNKTYAKSGTPTLQRDGKTIQYYWEIPGTGLMVDITIQNNCVDVVTDRYETVVQTTLHYEIAINPEGCENENDEVNKGIMKVSSIPVS